jgi:lysozyme
MDKLLVLLFALLFSASSVFAFGFDQGVFKDPGSSVFDIVKREAAIKLLIPIIKKFENFSATPYHDHDGTWTIGWGFTNHITRRSRMTREQADALLEALARETLDKTVALTPILQDSSPGHIAAMSDFAYNIGTYGYQKSKVAYYVTHDQCFAEKRELLKYVHAKGRTLPGLVIRRHYEMDMYQCK